MISNLRARVYDIIYDVDRIVEDLTVKIGDLSEDELKSFLDDLELQRDNLEALL